MWVRTYVRFTTNKYRNLLQLSIKMKLKMNMACSDSVICVYCTVGYSSRKEGPAGPWVNATGKGHSRKNISKKGQYR
jgi:hypothetical protein